MTAEEKMFRKSAQVALFNEVFRSEITYDNLADGTLVLSNDTKSFGVERCKALVDAVAKATDDVGGHYGERQWLTITMFDQVFCAHIYHYQNADLEPCLHSLITTDKCHRVLTIYCEHE